MAGYAHPETLVETAWVAEHKDDPNVRIAEVDVDTTAYEQGHIPGAVGWNWTTQLCDPVRRDILPKAAFERLMAAAGIGNDTTVILYGDNNNWFAAWALWQMKLYGHKDVRLMNGGRRKWLEEGRELTTEPPKREARELCGVRARSLAARLPARGARGLAQRSHAFVDVRSPDEFRARSWRRPACPNPASAAATSRAPPTSPGARSATRTARSSPTTRSRRSTPARG